MSDALGYTRFNAESLSLSLFRQTTDNTEIYYSMGMRGITPELQQMAWPILDRLDNSTDWDWSQFDMDGNGALDSVVMIHSGYGAETFTTDCHGRLFKDRIWAHG